MSASTDGIVNHLEFLGYTIERVEPKNPGDKLLMVARHPGKYAIVFFDLIPSFVMFRVNLTTERIFASKMETVVNKANKLLSISRLYFDIENGKAVLRLEAVYSGDYNKILFGQFLDILIADQTVMYQAEGFADSFLGTDRTV